VFTGIVESLPGAQPFRYPSGLIEIPMSPISDIFAFRNGRWPLVSFLEAIGRAVEWTITGGAVFDFLAHPACLLAMDPDLRVIDLICRLVGEAGARAGIATLGTIAAKVERTASTTQKPSG